MCAINSRVNLRCVDEQFAMGRGMPMGPRYAGNEQYGASPSSPYAQQVGRS